MQKKKHKTRIFLISMTYPFSRIQHISAFIRFQKHYTHTHIHDTCRVYEAFIIRVASRVTSTREGRRRHHIGAL